MTRKPQSSMDGVPFDSHRARFSGTVPLETEEIEATSLDEVLVMVVVVRVQDVQAKVVKGELERVNVLKVTDTRLLTGDLKKILVERLGLYGTDTVEPEMVDDLSVDDLSVDDLSVDDLSVDDLSVDDLSVDLETGEVLDASEPVFSPAIDDEEGVVTLGHIGDRHPRARSERRDGGPKVKPYSEDDGGPSVPVGEVVGRIGRQDRGVLTAFLEEI
jgi:hypothetical protein